MGERGLDLGVMRRRLSAVREPAAMFEPATGGGSAEPWLRRVEIGRCTLYQADCLVVLPTLGRVDALVTDPPYGIDEAGTCSDKSRGFLVDGRDYGSRDWDKITADDAIALAVGLARWSIVFGGNYYRLPPTTCWLVWDKLNGDTHFADCELAWTNLPIAVRRIALLWSGFRRGGGEGGRQVQRVHPTQKPIEVMKWCLSHLPDPCGTILDPFMGSGTTGVAAVRMGKRFIGIEREGDYFDAACRRIEEAYAQPDLLVESTSRSDPVEDAQMGLAL